MDQTVTVRRGDVCHVAERAFPGYRGPKHAVVVTEHHTISATDLCAQGGTWSDYVALKNTAQPGMQWWTIVTLTTLSPWSSDTWTGAIPDDVVLVEHRRSCGHDLGLRYYVSPTSQFLATARHLLPAPTADLTRAERVVLEAMCALKSAYRAEEYRRAGLSAADEREAYLTLERRGWLKSDSIGRVRVTVEGENARRALPRAS